MTLVLFFFVLSYKQNSFHLSAFARSLSFKAKTEFHQPQIWWWLNLYMSNQIFNFVPRVLSYPPPGAREGRVGENPGNEVAKYFFGSGYCPHPLLGRILRVLWHVKSIPRGYQAILSITSSGHASVTRKFTRSYVSGLGAWFLARKTVSSHQISILPRNQGLFISVARKLVNFEGNPVFFDCSYGSRQQVLVPFA